MMRNVTGIVVLVLGMAAVTSGCTATPMCMPGGSQPCCSPGDSQLCTADGGVDGLRACGMSGFWSDCVPYGDVGPIDHQAPPADTGALPDFGHVEY